MTAAVADDQLRNAPRSSAMSRLGLDKYSALYLGAAFFVFFGITKTSTFLDWNASIGLTFGEKTLVGVLALAFLVPLTTQTFDLSIGSILGLSLVMMFKLNEKTGLPEWLIMLIAIAACGAVGFISGFIVVRLNVDSFIATLGVSQVVNAMILLISNNRQITAPLSKGFRKAGQQLIFGLPLYFYYMIILAVALWFVLEHMPLGRHLFATGGNREAARLAGLSTDRLRWGSLVVSATISGFAGVVYAWKNGIFQNSPGGGFLFPAVAAVFFGASQLKGRPNVWGTLIAVYVLAFGVKGLQLSFNAGTYWIEPLFYGISLLVAVALASRQGIIKVRKFRRGTTPPAT
jgi:ribose transport system permease protein